MYIVTGVPGAGKSTILEYFLKSKPKSKFKIVKYGDEMFKIAKKKKLVKRKDEMRMKIEYGEYQKIQLTAAKKISKMRGNIILDSHSSIKTSYGYIPCFPLHILKTLKPRIIVVIEANPRDILKQRKKDVRFRMRSDFGGLGDTIEFQMMNRMYVVVYSALSGATVFIVENVYGKPKIAAKKLEEVLK